MKQILDLGAEGKSHFNVAEDFWNEVNLLKFSRRSILIIYKCILENGNNPTSFDYMIKVLESSEFYASNENNKENTVCEIDLEIARDYLVRKGIIVQWGAFPQYKLTKLGTELISIEQ